MENTTEVTRMLDKEFLRLKNKRPNKNHAFDSLPSSCGEGESADLTTLERNTYKDHPNNSQLYHARLFHLLSSLIDEDTNGQTEIFERG